MKAQEFAKTHRADQDWIDAMGDSDVTILEKGQVGTYSGFPACVESHFHNGMYNVKLARGSVCISGSEFIPTIKPELHQFSLSPSKTYASKENAVKAVEKVYANCKLRYMIVWNEQGRCFPLFVGEAALQHGVHHRGFCVTF